jgi:PAS domain-containing protein
LLWNVDEEKRKEDEMRARDDVWGTLLKIFPGWMWVARPDGTPEFLSQATLEYSGLSLEQVLRDRLQSLHPDDRQHRNAFWDQLINTEQPGEMETHPWRGWQVSVVSLQVLSHAGRER